MIEKTLIRRTITEGRAFGAGGRRFFDRGARTGNPAFYVAAASDLERASKMLADAARQIRESDEVETAQAKAERVASSLRKGGAR